jgi:GT2 family glycosyltransferase
MAHSELVSITIVTYNSARFIVRCVDSVLAQSHLNIELIIIDNASTDDTRQALRPYTDKCRIVFNDENVGFAAAQNQAIRMARGEWILTLNPDMLLTNTFVEALLQAGRIDTEVGTVCGKLLTMSAEFALPAHPVVDSTGIFFTPMLRHLDRGSQEQDNGHYLNYEYVFGATAAAALYRRSMIDDICVDGEFFDPDFFVYREDADVAWRAQLMGWRCLYAPHARAYHVRTVLPGNRRALPPVINMHSVKNRFLMRIKNMTGDLYRRNWLSITARDIAVIGCCLVREHSSLKAFWYLARNWRRFVTKRRDIMRRRRVSDEYIATWFHYTPVSKPVPNGTAAALRPHAQKAASSAQQFEY